VAGHARGVCKQVSRAESTQSIVEFIVGHGLSNIVPVGHGYGGTSISKVAELIPDRVRRLVFYSGTQLSARRLCTLGDVPAQKSTVTMKTGTHADASARTRTASRATVQHNDRTVTTT
jgi:pimeloyl-ACP methyl ester carboxylesterase